MRWVGGAWCGVVCVRAFRGIASMGARKSFGLLRYQAMFMRNVQSVYACKVALVTI